MGTLAYNISRIKDRVTASRQEILEAISEIQQIVYSQNTEQSTYIDPATGMPPFLTTYAGVFHYELGSTVRRTVAVFSEGRINGFNRTRSVGPNKEYYFRNRGYCLVAATSRDATPDSVATLTFQEDPGDTTSVFYHQYYLNIDELTDESQNLTLPAHTHMYLRKATIELFRTEEYGESGFDIQAIEAIAKKIRKELNGGYQGRSGRTPIRDEEQTYLRRYGY